MNSEKKRLISYEANIRAFLDRFGVGCGNTMFITLTFRNNLTDKILAGKAFDHLKKFISSKRHRMDFLKEVYPNYTDERKKKMANLDVSRLSYVCVWERQKRGAWHAHLLVNLPNWGTKNLKFFLRWIVKRVGLRSVDYGQSTYRRDGDEEKIKCPRTKYVPKQLTYDQVQLLKKYPAFRVCSGKGDFQEDNNYDQYSFGYIDVKWTWTFSKGKKVNDIKRPVEGDSTGVFNRWDKAVNSAKKYLLKYILKQRGDVRNKGCRLISFSAKGFLKPYSSNYNFNTEQVQNNRLVYRFIAKACTQLGELSFDFERLFWRIPPKKRIDIPMMFLRRQFKALTELIVGEKHLHMSDGKVSKSDVLYNKLLFQFSNF